MRARTRLVIGGAVGVLLAAVVATLVAAWPSSEGEGSRTAASPDPAHAAPAGIRTLVVRRGKREPSPSQPGGVLHALLLEGKAPAGEVVATVTSDEDCAPDSKGISHCLNRLRLDGGRRLMVRHPHAMQEVPCMTPGERIRVISG